MEKGDSLVRFLVSASVASEIGGNLVWFLVRFLVSVSGVSQVLIVYRLEMAACSKSGQS